MAWTARFFERQETYPSNLPLGFHLPSCLGYAARQLFGDDARLDWGLCGPYGLPRARRIGEDAVRQSEVGRTSEIMSTPLRVVVAGLGNMGRSHALAYETNPGFEIAALINRSDAPLPDALKSHAIRRSFEETLRRRETGPCLDQHVFRQPCRLCGEGAGGRLPCLRREASGNDCRRCRARRRCGKGKRPQARCRLYPAPSPVLDAAYRRSAQTGRALCLPDEFEPAIQRPHVEDT